MRAPNLLYQNLLYHLTAAAIAWMLLGTAAAKGPAQGTAAPITKPSSVSANRRVNCHGPRTFLQQYLPR